MSGDYTIYSRFDYVALKSPLRSARKNLIMSNSLDLTIHGIPIRNVWHMLMYAWSDAPLRAQISMADVESAPTLDALFSVILMKLIQQRMRVGLGRGYIPESKRLRAVRGRINFPASLKEQTFERGEANCDFEQYSVNEPRNQILRSALARLVQTGEFGSDTKDADDLRHQLRWLVRNLNGVDLIDLHMEDVRRQALAQNDQDYRLMLSLCELLLLRWMPNEIAGTQPTPEIDRDALVLHRIYERFVASFYRIHLKDWDVSPQRRLDWHAEEANPHLPSMIPDLILQSRTTEKLVVLDTKFTAASLVENQWGKLVYDSSHLYQMYAYLRSQEQMSAGHRSAEGILLYPTVRTQLSERVQLQGHTVRIESVDLAADWPEVERQLLRVIEA